MYSEIGQFSLLLVALTSLASIAFSVMWLRQKRERFFATQLALVHTSFLLSITSIVTLAVAFVTDDFSLSYVSSHSNSELPLFFKAAAVWGGHEGSLLFWVITLALWNSAIALLRKRIPAGYLSKVLLISSTLVAVFALFTLIASNPFALNEVLPEEGRDLNPMLQDIALIFHPPLLYIGYIGFASSFAFALASLWQKKIPDYWYSISREFTMVSWLFLTAGILLGAWWAYYELGWGGWWFWDPVENASLLPWLTATALVHSLIISADKNRLIGWSLGLSFITFSLSLLGTFVVRSGILTSVHAFAVDPTRGVVLIVILLILVLAGFGSQIYRSDDIQSKPLTHFASKSFLFLLVNGLFVIAMLTVLLGTFYPMIFQILGLGKISVGAPYFNTLFAPITFIALLLMSIAPLISGKKDGFSKRFFIQFIISVVIGYALYRIQYVKLDWMVLLTWILSAQVVVSTTSSLFKVSKWNSRTKMLPMWLAHFGVVLVCVGAAMNASHSLETSDRMQVGSKTEFGDFTISFDEQRLYVGPNYTSEQVFMLANGKDSIIPERRHYQVRVMNMTEPGIENYWHGDLYVTLGEKLHDGSFAIRIQYKAYVQWIWFGGVIMILGGLLGFVLRLIQVPEKRKNYAND